MAFEAIPFDQEVNVGDKLKFIFSFYDLLYIIRPTEEELLQSADNAPGFSVSTVKYNLVQGELLGEAGEIIGIVTEKITPAEISEGIKNSWSQNFKTIKGISIKEVDIDKFSIASFKPSVSTTISLSAIAIILVVLFIQFGSISRRLTT